MPHEYMIVHLWLFSRITSNYVLISTSNIHVYMYYISYISSICMLICDAGHWTMTFSIGCR